MSSTSKIYDAVVIGSGLAGLGAAYTCYVLKNLKKHWVPIFVRMVTFLMNSSINELILKSVKF